MGAGSGSALESEFLYRELERLLREGAIRREHSVLVICGGAFDQAVLDALGFSDVTISSLALPARVDPKRFRVEDAENLTLEDNSRDIVLVHAGLHHCASPHRALAEMHRVARHAALVFENQDSLLVRLLCRAGLSQEYELDAVSQNGGVRGGVRDTATPNYVYRWTRREIEKTLRSLDAAHEPSFTIRTSLHFNEWHLRGRLGAHPIARVLPQAAFRALARLGLWTLNALMSGQGNLLFLAVFKSRARLLPWMSPETVSAGADARDGVHGVR